jgi:CheY-like chemotaxis protein/prefoldin subunit 5
MASLRIKHPDDRGELLHLLSGDRITIGRRPDNTIQIMDRTVSGHHAELIATNGHYRLHDLGSTNLTCVDGQPVVDFHLHRPCKVSFGTVECEFSPETARGDHRTASEIVPTRADLDYLKRENSDLQKTITALQKQIDILSSARLITKETTHAGIPPETQRRLATENSELRKQNEELKQQAANLKSDLAAVTRDRDATRQAWETVKGELLAAQHALEALCPGSNARGAVPVPAPLIVPPNVAAQHRDDAKKSTIALPRNVTGNGSGTHALPAVRATAPASGTTPSAPAKTPIMSPDAHRAMASVVTKAPALLDGLRKVLERTSNAPFEHSIRDQLLADSKRLMECTSPIKGHPVQRLVVSFDTLIRGEKAFEPANMRALNQGIELARSLFDPKHLKRLNEIERARVLLIDDDQELLATLGAALDNAEIVTAKATRPSEALALLPQSHFDLILLDIGLPEQSGIELCAKIREMTTARKTPVVFLTARDTVENRAQSSLHGGNDFITKPFNIAELTLKAQTWIYRAQFGLIG